MLLLRRINPDYLHPRYLALSLLVLPVTHCLLPLHNFPLGSSRRPFLYFFLYNSVREVYNFLSKAGLNTFPVLLSIDTVRSDK